MVVTLGQRYHTGEKPTVMLYTYINQLVVHFSVDQYQVGWMIALLYSLERIATWFVDPSSVLLQNDPGQVSSFLCWM